MSNGVTLLLVLSVIGVGLLIYEGSRRLQAYLIPKSIVSSEHTCEYCKSVYTVKAKTYVLDEETIKTSTIISACHCDRESNLFKDEE